MNLDQHLPRSRLLAVVRLVGLLGLTIVLLPVQFVALKFGASLSRRLPGRYHAWCLRLMGARLAVHGTVSDRRPTLYISNHVSYLDILALSAATELSFIAKREVGEWPLIGTLARLQRTVFVDRRRASVADERDSMIGRLRAGDSLVLFPEGTTSDGNRALAFKSAFFAVVEDAREAALAVQPVTIAYTKLDNMPLGRDFRPTIAWYGLMELGGHAMTLLGLGRIVIDIYFHPVVEPRDFAGRKALARHCEHVIARGLARANAGRAA